MPEYSVDAPRDALEIIARLNAAGFEAYAVGGCVRDSLMGNRPSDWDIAASASPEEVSAALEGLSVLPTGLRHGTVTVLLSAVPYEITTYRVDGPYLDGRRPERVSFTSSLREDLARRDFTVNAMAWHPALGLVDCFGGAEDLRDGVLRCVGDPEERFSEDALRILRCVRFACTLGFRIEEETARAMHLLRGRLNLVARERIRAELLKALPGRFFKEVFSAHPGILAECIPELGPCIGFGQKTPHHIYDVYRHTLRAVSLGPPEPVVRMALLLHDLGKPAMHTRDENGIDHFKGHPEAGFTLAQDILKRLRYPKAEAEQIEALVRWHNADIPAQPKAVRRWLGCMGEELFGMLLAVKRADAGAHAPASAAARLEELDALEQVYRGVLESGDCFQTSMLAIGGAELMEAGMRPGPEMGETLRTLTELVVEEALPNEREALLTYVRERLQAR